MGRENWRSRVYADVAPFVPVDSRLRAAVLKRDNEHCQMCRRSINLSVHHVIPRAESGPDTKENLITLCNLCHDYVELNDIRSAELIRGWQAEEGWKPEKTPMGDPDDWRTWVYGGRRCPRK